MSPLLPTFRQRHVNRRAVQLRDALARRRAKAMFAKFSSRQRRIYHFRSWREGL